MRRQFALLLPAPIFIVALGIAPSTAQLEARSMQTERDKTGGVTVWDAVYTEAQAARGRTGYSANCSSCHRDDLSGYDGVLEGERFMTAWREDTLSNLFKKIKTTMPRGGPGSLSDNVYLDILAYVLQANNVPAGNEELKLDARGMIHVTAKEGPQPLPGGAWVQVVGCLTQGTDNAWILTSASEPLRIRDSQGTAEDLNADQARPLGTRTFELLDAGQFNPALHKGHRMEAKGFLILRPKDRLNLTAPGMVAVTCVPQP